jgi:predicted amidohydrolase
LARARLSSPGAWRAAIDVFDWLPGWEYWWMPVVHRGMLRTLGLMAMQYALFEGIAMMKRSLSMALLGLLAAAGAVADEQVLKNPRLAADADGMPVDWTIWQPEHREASCRVAASSDGLRFDAPADRPFAVGGVEQTVAIKAGQAYAVEAHCTTAEAPAPYRAAGVRLMWLRDGKPLHPAGVLVRGPMPDGQRWKFRDVYVAPAEADAARLSLEVKWPQGGAVVWHSASLTPTDPPKPRKVKVGTVYLFPRGTTPEKNIELFSQQIDEAGRLKLDIVCLGEALTMVGTSKKVSELAEPIPGPTCDAFAAAAKRNNVWVVAGLLERDGETIYNTAVLLGRDGKLAGKYRKTHLPREEWTKGISPGSEYPVFETEFGTVGMLVCYDWFFPEVATIFGQRGAEIVFAPTWGSTFADKEGRVEGANVFRVRARDAGIYLVPSVYNGSSMIIDPLGRVLASNEGKDGVFWAEIDLAVRDPLWWVGHWRSIAPRDRMPETYDALQEPPRPR